MQPFVFPTFLLLRNTKTPSQSLMNPLEVRRLVSRRPECCEALLYFWRGRLLSLIWTQREVEHTDLNKDALRFLPPYKNEAKIPPIRAPFSILSVVTFQQSRECKECSDCQKKQTNTNIIFTDFDTKSNRLQFQSSFFFCRYLKRYWLF